MRWPLALLFLPLSGCLTVALWERESATSTAEETSTMQLHIDAAGVAGDPPALLLSAHRTRGRAVAEVAGGLHGPLWFELTPIEPQQLEQLQAVLQGSAPVDTIEVDLQWRSGSAVPWAAELRLTGPSLAVPALQSRWWPRLVAGPSTRLLPIELPPRQRLQLFCVARREVASTSATLGKVLLTPLAVAGDVVIAGLLVYGALLAFGADDDD